MKTMSLHTPRVTGHTLVEGLDAAMALTRGHTHQGFDARVAAIRCAMTASVAYTVGFVSLSSLAISCAMDTREES